MTGWFWLPGATIQQLPGLLLQRGYKEAHMAHEIRSSGGVAPRADTTPHARHELQRAAAPKGNNREMLRLRASRFADLIPDELVIREKTVSVVRREFLMSHTETLPVKDIGRVIYINAPLFDGLEIMGKNPAHDLRICGLRKADALEAKEVLEGLLLEERGVVDVPDWLHTDTRREMLAKAGKHAPGYK